MQSTELENFKTWFLNHYTMVWELYGGSSTAKAKRRAAFPNGTIDMMDGVPAETAFSVLVDNIQQHTRDQIFTVRLSPKPGDYTNQVTKIISRSAIMNAASTPGQSFSGQSFSQWPQAMNQSLMGAPNVFMLIQQLNSKDLEISELKRDIKDLEKELEYADYSPPKNMMERWLELCGTHGFDPTLGFKDFLPAMAAMKMAKTNPAAPIQSAAALAGDAPGPNGDEDEKEQRAMEEIINFLVETKREKGIPIQKMRDTIIQYKDVLLSAIK